MKIKFLFPLLILMICYQDTIECAALRPIVSNTTSLGKSFFTKNALQQNINKLRNYYSWNKPVSLPQAITGKQLIQKPIVNQVRYFGTKAQPSSSFWRTALLTGTTAVGTGYLANKAQQVVSEKNDTQDYNESVFQAHPLGSDLQNDVITFKAIQDIHQLAKQAAEEGKKYGISWLQLGAETWPGSNAFWNQTEQGLYMTLRMGLPGALYTPWGSVKIYGSGSLDAGANLNKLFDTFNKHLELEFVSNTAEYGKVYSSDKIKFFVDDFNHEITKEELEKYRGTNRRIFTNYADYDSLYKIKSINGIPLPEPKKLDYRDYRKYETVKTNWKNMMNVYQELYQEIQKKKKASSCYSCNR